MQPARGHGGRAEEQGIINATEELLGRRKTPCLFKNKLAEKTLDGKERQAFSTCLAHQTLSMKDLPATHCAGCTAKKLLLCRDIGSMH